MVKAHFKGYDEVLVRVVLQQRGIDTYTADTNTIVKALVDILHEENARNSPKPARSRAKELAGQTKLFEEIE